MRRHSYFAVVAAASLAAAITTGAGAADPQLKGRYTVMDGTGSTSPISMTIEAHCQDGVPTFVVINDGGRWPGRAAVRVFKIATNEQLTERQMVLMAGQTFRVRVDKAGKDELGLTVEPSWLKRDGQVDAKVKCS